MMNGFDRILDECIDRINRGEDLSTCLTDYPEYAQQLRPLLQTILKTKEAYLFEPLASAKRALRQRLNAALEELARTREEKRSLFPWVFGRSRAWVAVTVVLLVALIGYFGLRPILFPAEPGPITVTPAPQPSPEGNFVFLISDDVNAIGDFQNLNISISKIGLQAEGEDGQWIEFDPEIEVVDLTLLQGDKAHEIWRGDVPEGQYTKVFIHVTDVRGVLKETGRTVEVKLPSQKLQISKSFQVTADMVTSFTYDLTVIAAGSPQSGIKYILKPQVDQSGADHKPSESKRKRQKAVTQSNE